MICYIHSYEDKQVEHARLKCKACLVEFCEKFSTHHNNDCTSNNFEPARVIYRKKVAEEVPPLVVEPVPESS